MVCYYRCDERLASGLRSSYTVGQVMAARTKSRVTPEYKTKYRVKNWPERWSRSGAALLAEVTHRAEGRRIVVGAGQDRARHLAARKPHVHRRAGAHTVERHRSFYTNPMYTLLKEHNPTDVNDNLVEVPWPE